MSAWGSRKQYDDKNTSSSNNEDEFVDTEEEVQLDTDMSNVIVVDNVPLVDSEKLNKLQTFLAKAFSKYGELTDTGLYIPFDEEKQQTKGFAFVEYKTAKEADAAVKALDGFKFDKNHTFKANKFSDFDEINKQIEQGQSTAATPEEDYLKQIEAKTKVNLNDWLLTGADQFLIRFWDETQLYKMDPTNPNKPEIAYKRTNWTESTLLFSPFGRYLATFHQKGLALWGGQFTEGVTPLVRLPHQGLKFAEFSPRENYVITMADLKQPNVNKDGFNYILWETKTGKLLRGFKAQEKETNVWPLYKWSHDEKFFAKLVPDGIAIYETATQTLIDKKPFAIPGVKDFSWSPTNNIICYWVPEIENKPARVTLMNVPQFQEVRSKNFFLIKDIKMSWHDQGHFLCIKADRGIDKKTKKSSNTLEMFRMRDKDVPVEVIEMKEDILSFAWEPTGIRFAIIHGDLHSPNAQSGAASANKPSLSFHTMGAVRNGNHKLLKTFEKKAINQLYWSPRGSFIVLAGLRGTMNGTLEFFNVDMMETLHTDQHFACTDVEWDPSGRYIATSVNYHRYSSENGYMVWSVIGEVLQKVVKEKLWQFAWRKRPASLLTEEQERHIVNTIAQRAQGYIDSMKQHANSQARAEQREKKAVLDSFKSYVKEVEKLYNSQREQRQRLRGGYESDPGEDYEITEEVIETVVETKIDLLE